MTDNTAENQTGWTHRLTVAGEYLNRGMINTVSALGYVVDGVNHSPRLLNAIPGVEGFTPMSDRPFLGSAMIYDNLAGGYGAYKDVMGVQTPELKDGTDRAIAGVAELAGGFVVPMGGLAGSTARTTVNTVKAGRTVAATATAARPVAALADDAVRSVDELAALAKRPDIAAAVTRSADDAIAPLDAVTDFLAKGNGKTTRLFTDASGASRAISVRNGIAAAQLPRLSSATAFAGAVGGRSLSALKTGAGIAAPLLGTTALTAGRLTTIAGLKFAKHGTLFSLRHPFIATAGAGALDVAYNDGALTKAAARKATQFATGTLPGLAATAFDYASTGVPKLIPTIDIDKMLRDANGKRLPVTKAIEEGLGIDIPDNWEPKANKLMRDFGRSSFGQWLVGGSWGAKLVGGLFGYVVMNMATGLLRSNEGGLLSRNTALTALNLGVAATVAQNLPALVKALAESPVSDNDNRMTRSLDFAPSNTGGMAGGMSFAPA